MAAGAEFVDVELRAEFAAELVRLRRGRGVIASMHICSSRARRMSPERVRACGPPAPRSSSSPCEVESLAETLPLFELGGRHRRVAPSGRTRADRDGPTRRRTPACSPRG